MKNYFINIISFISIALSYLFGGFSTSLLVLLIFMGIDVVTALIVAAVFHKSPKTVSGKIESNSFLKGIFRKILILIFVVIGNLLDIVLKTEFIKNAVIISFIINELLSIIENAVLMGLPIPKVIKQALEILNEKEGEKND